MMLAQIIYHLSGIQMGRTKLMLWPLSLKQEISKHQELFRILNTQLKMTKQERNASPRKLTMVKMHQLPKLAIFKNWQWKNLLTTEEVLCLHPKMKILTSKVCFQP